MTTALRRFVALLALSLLVGCATQRFDARQAYIEDFVLRETGDAALAGKLGADARKAWEGAAHGLREGRSTRDNAAALREQGINVVVLPPGARRIELPGRTVSMLLMDVTKGCRQIVREQWVSAQTDGPARLALVGIGRQDLDDRPTTEKKIDMMAFELPAAGDYLDISTNSLSPFGKVIIAFGAVIGLTGCDDEKQPASVPLTANFQIDPNLTATPDRPANAQGLVKDGVWDPTTTSIAYNAEATLKWTSFTKTYTALKGDQVVPVPGNTVRIWLTNADRVKIIGIRPAGHVDSDGRRAIARTDLNGNIYVDIERRGIAGEMSSTLWGHDPAHDATKKVDITMPPT